MSRSTTTMLATCAFAAATAACGHKAPTAATLDNHVPPSTTSACPDAAALEAVARAAWGKEGGEVDAACAAVRERGESLWVIEGSFTPDGDGASGDDQATGDDDRVVGVWTAVVTPDGQRKWRDGDDDIPARDLAEEAASPYTIADLDGDGDDELLHVSHSAHGAYEMDELWVARVQDYEVTTVGEGLRLSHDLQSGNEADTGYCTAEWTLVPVGATKQIAITTTGDDGCDTGRRLWRLDVDGLVEVAP